MGRKRERRVQKDIVESAMSLPELAIEVMILITGRCTMEMMEVAAEETCEQDDAAEWRQCRSAFAGQNFRERQGVLCLAIDKRLIRSRKVSKNLSRVSTQFRGVSGNVEVILRHARRASSAILCPRWHTDLDRTQPRRFFSAPHVPSSLERVADTASRQVLTHLGGAIPSSNRASWRGQYSSTLEGSISS